MDERAGVVLLADRRFLDHVAAAGASRGRTPPCLETRPLSRLLRTTPCLTGYGHGRADALGTSGAELGIGRCAEGIARRAACGARHPRGPCLPTHVSPGSRRIRRD